MGRLRIQHCIINRITRQYGPHPTSDLLGVDYFHTISADVEYPYVVSQLELFVVRSLLLRIEVGRVDSGHRIT